jgi:hypothetical protein
MELFGIAITNGEGDQSPIRSRCSHCRKSPSKSHALRNLEACDEAPLILFAGFASGLAGTKGVKHVLWISGNRA